MPPTNAAFLVSGRALSRLFRAKVRAGLRTAGLLDQAPPAVWGHEWVVHVQQAGTGEKVLDYLARYVFRIAIVNSRLERFAEDHVTFRYRDGRTGSLKRCTRSRSSGAFCNTSCPRASPRSATTACSVPPAPTSSPRRASSSWRHRPVRSPPRPRSPRRPFRRSARDRAAQPAGSACCTSSRSFTPAVARHEHAAVHPTNFLPVAPPLRARARRRLPRERTWVLQHAPARRSRAGSTVAIANAALFRRATPLHRILERS